MSWLEWGEQFVKDSDAQSRNRRGLPPVDASKVVMGPPMAVEQISECKGCGLEVIKTRYIAPGATWCPSCGGMNRLVHVEGGKVWECEAPALDDKCGGCGAVDKGALCGWCNDD